jgi:hypothetical protein
MKKSSLLLTASLRISLFIFLLMLMSTSLFAQKDSVTTVPPLNGGNSAGGVSWNVKAYQPLTIKEVWGCFVSTAINVELWYHPTDSINGAPTVTTANGWVLLGTTNFTAAAAGVGVLVKLPLPLNIQMQANQVSGFALKTVTGSSCSYTNVSTSLPSLFFNNSLHVNCTTNVGYGGPSHSINSRMFNGKIVYEMLAQGPNNAGVDNLVAPVNFCPGNHNVQVKISNKGSNVIDSVRVNWELNGVPQPTVFVNTPMDTLNAVNPSFLNVTLGNVNFPANQTKQLKAWTSMPNGVADTINTDDTLTTSLTPSLSGTFTIGGTGADFLTISDAVAALQNGVCGPVVFSMNAAAGPFTGGVEIPVVTGTSATNTITFKGNGSTVNQGAAGYIFAINGTSHLTIDSFNIVNSTPSVNMFGIMVRGGAKYLTFTNNTIDMGIISTGAASGGIVITNSITSGTTGGNNAQYVTISNNSIIGGYYGVTLFGNASYLDNYGHSVSNNIIRDFYLGGIYMSNGDSSYIGGNNISRNVRTSLTTFYGIYLATSRFVKVEKNKIHSSGAGTYTAYPVYVSTSVNSAGNPTEFINNAIYNIPTTSTLYGMYLLGTRDYVNLYYNTVHLVTTAANTVRALFMSTAPNNHNIRNNVFSIAGNGSGAKFCIYVSTTSASMTANHNNYYMGATAGTNNLGYWTANRPTLNDWQTITSQDANSMSVTPDFYAVDDYRSFSSLMYRTAAPIAGITDDIDGDPRHVTTPCPGADEYVFILNDVSVTTMTSPIGLCAGLLPVSVVVKNFGLDTIYSMTIHWTINGVTQTPVFIGTNLHFGSSDTFSLGSFNFLTNVSYNLKFWATLTTPDQNNANDTLTINGFRTALSGNVTVGGTGANYPSPADLFLALNSFGVCGPVTVNVDSASGPYTGGIELADITGASDVNTITLNGNGAVINQGTNTFILAFNGTKHLTLNNFRIINSTPTNNIFGIMVRGGARYLNIANNFIDVGTTSTSSTTAGIAVSNSTTSATIAGDNGRNLSITNNEIAGGYYGLTLMGAASYLNCYGNVVSNNIIRDFYQQGLYLSNVDTITVHGNDINRATRAGLTTFYGIYVSTGRNMKITANRIHSSGVGSYTAYPVYISTSANSVSATSDFNNNMIYNIATTGTVYGIYLLGTRDYMNFYHNTIALEAGAGTKRSVFISTAPTNHNFRNNIMSMYGSGTGTRHFFYVSATSTTTVSNNNVYHFDVSGGTTNFGYVNSADVATLAAWQTATLLDANSMAENPVFASVAANNLTPLSGMIDNIGAPVGVVTDINGAARSLTTPDAGAIEFTGLSADIAVTSGLLVTGKCLATNDSVYITISNAIGTAINFAMNPLVAVWSVSGPVASSDSIVLNSGTLAQGASIQLGGSGVNLSQAGTYQLSVYIKANPVNSFAGNDTLTNTFSLNKVNPFFVNPSIINVTNSNDTVLLIAKSTLYSAAHPFMTEVSHFKTTAGQPLGGWPTYLLADDYIEISGVSNSSLAGYTLEQWDATSLVSTFTFASGMVLSPQGTAIIAVGQLGSSVQSLPNYYYHGNGSYTGSFGSTGAAGRILKDNNGNIVDAVGYGTYTFPAAAGVTSADWSGNTQAISSSGNRLQNEYTKNASNWVNSNITPMDPNVMNNIDFMPVPASVTGLNWTHQSTSLGNNPRTWVGPFTTNGTYQYVAGFNSVCGQLFDTVTVIVNIPLTPATITGDTSICEGDTVAISVQMAGVAPWTVVISDGLTTDTITGITSSLYQFQVAPTITTTYHVISYWDATMSPVVSGDSAVVTVWAKPAVALAPFSGVCLDAPAFALSGGTPAGGTYNGTGVAAGMFTPATAGTGLHAITYTYADTNSCHNSATANLQVFALPLIAFTGAVDTMCLNHVITLGAGTGFASYLWSTGANTQSISLDGNVLGVGAHVFSVTVTDNNGCVGHDSVSIYVDPCTSIKENAVSGHVRVYPNPVKDDLILEFKGMEGNILIEVFSVVGQRLVSETISLSTSGNHKMNLSYLHSGNYVVRIASQTDVVITRIVKE